VGDAAHREIDEGRDAKHLGRPIARQHLQTLEQSEAERGGTRELRTDRSASFHREGRHELLTDTMGVGSVTGISCPLERSLQLREPQIEGAVPQVDEELRSRVLGPELDRGEVASGALLREQGFFQPGDAVSVAVPDLGARKLLLRAIPPLVPARN
jgi:hypothetical protein